MSDEQAEHEHQQENIVVEPAKQDPTDPPDPDEPASPDEVANDNGPPPFQDALFEQSYPNAGMTAEERPPIPEGGIEPSPEPEPTPQ